MDLTLGCWEELCLCRQGPHRAGGTGLRAQQQASWRSWRLLLPESQDPIFLVGEEQGEGPLGV